MSNNKNFQKKGRKRRPAKKTSMRNQEQRIIREVIKHTKKNSGPRFTREPNLRNISRPTSSLARQMSSGMHKGIGRTLREEPSAAAWPSVYVDPFLQIDARLPIWPVRSTLCQMRKATVLDAHTNANGNGWICFVPANMICNDLAFAFYSNLTTGDPIASGSYTTLNCDGAYTAASFIGGGYSMRIVAFGFKIRYIGTELNKGGFITYHQMCPRNALNDQTASTIQSSFQEWKQVPFDNKLKMFTRLYTENDDGMYMNQQILDEDFGQWSYDDFATANSENIAYIGAYVSGAAPNQPFEVQIAAHFEIIGPLNNTTGVKSTMMNTQKHEKAINLSAAVRSKDNTTMGVSLGTIGEVGLGILAAL